MHQKKCFNGKLALRYKGRSPMRYLLGCVDGLVEAAVLLVCICACWVIIFSIHCFIDQNTPHPPIQLDITCTCPGYYIIPAGTVKQNQSVTASRLIQPSKRQTDQNFVYFQVCQTTFNFYRSGSCGSTPYVTKRCRNRDKALEDNNAATCVDKSIEQPSCSTNCSDAFCNFDNFPDKMYCKYRRPFLE